MIACGHHPVPLLAVVAVVLVAVFALVGTVVLFIGARRALEGLVHFVDVVTGRRPS